MSVTNSEIIGIVLAGGQSKRMGEDKALIAYHGETQLEATYKLLKQCCKEVYVSVSNANENEKNRNQFPIIVDTKKYSGPLAGILSAFEKFPHSAILIVACDLPLLNLNTLEFLISKRNAVKQATAFTSEFDGLPEPLCCIWEPSILENIHLYIDKGFSCPRKILINSDIELLKLPAKHALDNINTPKERAELQSLRNL